MTQETETENVKLPISNNELQIMIVKTAVCQDWITASYF